MNEQDTFDNLKYRIVVATSGTRCYYDNENRIHREDGPAVETHNGTTMWYIHGIRHRVDGPAIERYNGTKEWYVNGTRLSEEEFLKRIKMTEDDTFDRLRYHLVVSSTGTRLYHNNAGQLHRIGGPAVEWIDGDKEWFVEDELHREDGPAIELSNGTKKWYRKGKLHREDGPAVEYPYGEKQWWLNGQRIYKECPDG